MANVNFRINAEDNASPQIQKTRSSMDGLSTAADQLKGAFAAIGVGIFVKEIAEAAIMAEKLSTVFKVATGSATAAAKEMKFIREESQRLGLEFNSTADAYGKFMTAINGSSIEGEVGRQVFTGISEGMAALKKNGDESSRVFAQVQQSMSKGKIELEDMKIIAEAGIPIFKLLADSMGKGQAEIMKMMSDGKLLASETWPKVAEAMHKAFGKDALEAAQGAQAEINRFKNALEDSKRVLGEAFLPAMVEVLKVFTSAGDIIRPVVYVISSIKIEFQSLVDKFFALSDAGGLIGLITGGAEARAELSAQYKAIDDLAEYSKNKIFDRLNPTAQSGKSPEELQAERERNAERKRKEDAAKALEDEKKLMDERSAYIAASTQMEIKLYQGLNDIRMDGLKAQFDQTTANAQSTRAYYDSIRQSAQQAMVDESRLIDLERQKLAQNLVGEQTAEQKIKFQTEMVKLKTQENDAALKYGKVLQETANKELEVLRSKKKEIEEIRDAFQASNDAFAETKAKFTGDYSGGFAYLDPAIDQQTKLASLKDKLQRDEAAANDLTDPAKKAEKLKSLSDAWGNLSNQIDNANMSTSQKMMIMSDIEEERNRIQKNVLSAAEAEKAAMEANYNSAISKVQQYRDEMVKLDNVIKNMSRDITVNLKVNASGGSAQALINGTSLPTTGAADNLPTTTAQTATNNSGSSYTGQSTYYSGGRAYDTSNYNYGSANGSFSSGFDKLPDGYMSISSTPSYEVGTNYVPKDGLAYLHEGEAVVPKKYNEKGGGSGSMVISGDIQINLPNVTNIKEFARQLAPELQALQARYRKTA